jgi:hypothetical protein
MTLFDKYEALHHFNSLTLAPITPADELRLVAQLANALQDIYNKGFEHGFETCLETETPQAK